MFKTFGTSKEVFVNQDEGMFVALPITLDVNSLTLETETEGGRIYAKAGSVVKEGNVVLGILPERYDITEGNKPARIVTEGYAWASRLTPNAITAAASLPKIVIMPYKAILFSVAEQDGLKVVLHAEGTRFLTTAAASHFSVSGLTISGLKVLDDGDVAITFSGEGTGTITAINASAYVPVSGATVKGLPINLTVVKGDEHAVSVTTGSNGTAAADKTSAAEGEVVTVTTAPTSGSFVVDKVTANGVELTASTTNNYKFVMSDKDVAVNVTFKSSSV